jgi:hypothetical protein
MSHKGLNRDLIEPKERSEVLFWQRIADIVGVFVTRPRSRRTIVISSDESEDGEEEGETQIFAQLDSLSFETESPPEAWPLSKLLPPIIKAGSSPGSQYCAECTGLAQVQRNIITASFVSHFFFRCSISMVFLTAAFVVMSFWPPLH